MHPPTFRSQLFSEFSSYTKLLDFLSSYARTWAFRALRQGLAKGELIIEDEQGLHQFGTHEVGCTPVHMKVMNDILWARIFLSYDIGLSEAYMHGDFEVSSIKDMLNLWLDNREGLAALSTTLSALFRYYSALAINALGRQTRAISKANVKVAYDVSNDFMGTFLSKEMMYSCALWSDEENGPRGDLTIGPKSGDLEAAQHRKIRHILRNARIQPGNRLLEIGSGWGAMAVEAARLGCTVDTVTLSIEQKCGTEKRAAAAGVGDRVRVHLCDYRELPASFAGCFDALVSCEMIEAVGPKHYEDYFKVVDWALKKDRATVVITATTQPEHRYLDYQPDDFARHYHWPNTHLPSPTSLACAVQNVVRGRFVLYSIEDHGIHYPRTLREWGRRLKQNFHGVAVANLQKKYPHLHDEKKLTAFVKKWMYMFAYAEVGYARAYTSLSCWTFTRPENVSENCA